MKSFLSILIQMVVVALIEVCSAAELRLEEAHDAMMSEFMDMSTIRMEVTSAYLDGELEEAIVNIRLINESDKEIYAPIFRGLPLTSILQGNIDTKWREPVELSYWTAGAHDSFLAQNFRASGTSHLLVLRAEPQKTKDEGITRRLLQPFEKRDISLRFRVLDVRDAGEEVFNLRMLHREHAKIYKNHSRKNTLSYKEDKFRLKVTPKALARYQERKKREFTEPNKGKSPLMLSLKSASMDDKGDIVSLHVQLTNISEKPVHIGAGFRFKCVADEEDVALVLAEDEGGMRRWDMELEPGEVENMVVEFKTTLIKRSGKSAWKLRPSEAICNDLPFEVIVKQPFGKRVLDLREEETSEDEFVLPDPNKIWEYNERTEPWKPRFLNFIRI